MLEQNNFPELLVKKFYLVYEWTEEKANWEQDGIVQASEQSRFQSCS